MLEIKGVECSTATPVDRIKENINYNLKKGYSEANKSRDWRVNKPIAIVGGGPSLEKTIHELSNYQFVMVCGSAHDYVMKNNICVDYVVVCDPDPLVINYLKELKQGTEYLVASQCDPSTFEHLKNNKVRMYHAAGDIFNNEELFGAGVSLVGGGVTVGTRAMSLALAFGFTHLHLFGFDSCLTKEFKTHAYELGSPDEITGDIREIYLDIPNSPKYRMAGYMLAQVFDIKKMCEMYANRMSITVHGEGFLKDLFENAKETALKKLAEKELENGDKK